MALKYYSCFLCLRKLHTHTWFYKTIDIAVLKRTIKIWNAVDDYTAILLSYLPSIGYVIDGLRQIMVRDLKNS